MIIIGTFVSLAVLYLVLMCLYVYGWLQLPEFNAPKDYQASTTVCIIVPARNEAANIEACIESMLAQNFPRSLLEVIVVNDHSEDDTLQIVKNYESKSLEVLNLSDYISDQNAHNSYKKIAIATAIQQTKQELIVTTDADCVLPKNWLKTIVAFYESQPTKLITAPVVFEEEKGFLAGFQTLDFMGMICITGASNYMGIANMSNGANLAYERAVFHEVHGFQGIDDIASGDDFLLMQKIAEKYSDQIHFLKSQQATVQTKPAADWYEFVQQRIRWASKSSKYKDQRINVILLGVYLFNCSIIISLFMGWISWFLILLSVKLLTDFIFLHTIAAFFQRKRLLWLFLPAQLLHIIYIVIVGFLGNVSTYNWKGRKVK